MGAEQSALAPSTFTPEEVRRLGKRFAKLDSDRSGALDMKEFMAMPELRGNPLVQRVVDILDTDSSGTVDFKEFVQGLATFAVAEAKEEKLRFVFSVYDMDKDGFISREELYTVLKMMVGNNLKEVQLQQVVNRTFRDVDKDMDGKISFEEFKAIIGNMGVEKKMVVKA